MRPVIKGKFIVFDGLDFCGKGTQARLLAEYLLSHPLDESFKLISVLSTREPSNSEYTLELRNTMQSESDPSAKMRKLAELFVNDRKHHVQYVIDPALKSGTWVISDRYMYSTLAYQQTQGMDFKELLAMHGNITVPDAVFIVDISGEESIARKAKKRDKRPDEMFDQLGFQSRLRENYLALKGRLPGHPIYIVDGMRPVEDIARDIKKYVDVLVEDALSNISLFRKTGPG